MKMELRSREIDKLHKRRDRYEIAEWQRGELWSTEKKQLVLDSILRDWHLPKFYFVKVSEAPETWEVVDGQQRLVTIFEFLDNALALSPATAKVFGGQYYKELDPDVSDCFDDYKIDYEEITEAEEGEAQEYFIRLQQGLTLTTAERLNAVPGSLTTFVRKLSRHKFFSERVALRDYRNAFFDICCKVAAIEIESLDTRLRLAELQEVLSSHSTFSTKSAVAKRVQSTFDFLHDEVFTERSPILRNRSVIQSIATLTARLLQSDNMKGRGPRLREFFNTFMRALVREVEKGHQATQLDLLEFQSTISANLVSGPETRHRILMRRLLVFDTVFADVLGPQSVAESGMSSQIGMLADRIKELTYVVNKRYENQHGIDLFKPTNETAQAFDVISNPIGNVQEYGALIDSLYFLLFEGSSDGQRFQGSIPECVEDIRVLRTDIRHDLDHGKSTKVRAKRKRAGKTFVKYGDVSSVQVLSPEKFSLVQTRILTAVLEMLEQMAPAG